jgi:hypothetical protein
VEGYVDGVAVFAKSINNHGTKLEDFSRHVAASTTKSSPVGKNHDGESLFVEIANGLGGLVRRIREKYLSCA